jgi:hypothetical protein
MTGMRLPTSPVILWVGFARLAHMAGMPRVHSRGSGGWRVGRLQICERGDQSPPLSAARCTSFRPRTTPFR